MLSNSKIRHIGILASIGAMAVMSADHTYALTISDADSFTNILTEIVNEPLSVDLFDDMGGTLQLTKVTVTLGGNLTSSGQVTNRAAQNEMFNVSTLGQSYRGTLQAGGPASLPGMLDIFSPFARIQSQDYDLASNTSGLFGPGSANSSAMFMTTDQGELDQFIGIGAFGYDINSIILTTIQGGGGNVDISIETLADADLTVVYEFNDVGGNSGTVVPEPISATLGLIGLVSLSTATKRRR